MEAEFRAKDSKHSLSSQENRGLVILAKPLACLEALDEYS